MSSQVTFIYIALLTIQIVSKHLTECQESKIIRLNTQFSVKGISLLNSVMASSSSVQFKKFLFNQVDDIAGNEVSPTKQARGDSGKEPKLHW